MKSNLADKIADLFMGIVVANVLSLVLMIAFLFNAPLRKAFQYAFFVTLLILLIFIVIIYVKKMIIAEDLAYQKENKE